MSRSGWLALSVTVLVACGDWSTAKGKGDGNVTGASCTSKLSPSDPCLAELACGNSLNVGKLCSKGGGECGLAIDFEHAFFCTVDHRSTPLAYCTKPCREDKHCGEGAVCTEDPNDPKAQKGCLPIACVGVGEQAPPL